MMKTSVWQNVCRIAIGVLMIFAGVTHLTTQREEFRAQVPRWLPDNEGFMDFVVVSSGVAEILLGLVMLLFTKHKVLAGIMLASFFVLIFPGNISQYTNGIDGFGLDTDRKRLIRLFLQPLFIFMALWSTGALAAINQRFRKHQRD